jgi:hypothetical protein
VDKINGQDQAADTAAEAGLLTIQIDRLLHTFFIYF